MKYRKAVSLVSLLLALCSAGAMAQAGFTVGTATAAPGQKATGFIQVPAGVDAATAIPVAGFQGTKPGAGPGPGSCRHRAEEAFINAPGEVSHSPGPAQISRTVI